MVTIEWLLYVGGVIAFWWYGIEEEEAYYPMKCDGSLVGYGMMIKRDKTRH